MVARRRETGLALVCALGALTACEAVLGFEDFERGAGGGAATSAGTAGVAGSGGGAGASGAPSGGSSAGGSSGGGAGGASGGGAGAAGSAGSGGAGCPAESPPGTAGPTMIQLARPDGSCFWMDETEVTRGDYDDFLASNPDVGAQAVLCDFNTGFETSACDGDAGPPAGDQPVGCVEWCDAYAFCEWTGKTLCAGAYGSGQAIDAQKSRWYSACSSNGSNDYPYGTQYDQNACNGDERAGTGCGAGSCETVAPGSLTTCDTPAGVSDLSGNVAEWVDECNATSGASDQCYVRGGGANDPFDRMSCKSVFSRGRDYAHRFVGFRCCRDSGT